MHKVGTVWRCFEGGHPKNMAPFKAGTWWRGEGHTYWLTHFKSRLPKKNPRHQQQQGQLQRQFELIHKPKTVANAGLHARFYIFFGIVVHPLRECQPKTVTYINKSD